MRFNGVLFALGLWLAVAGCRTPVKPATVPVANLYPTLNPSAILVETRPVQLSEAELSALLAHLGALGPLRASGMGPGELPLALRGLARHGYSELDARRTACPVRWVVLRCVTEATRPCLVVEVGFAATPPVAAQLGISVAGPAAALSTRNDAYHRISRVECWRGTTGQAAVEVRRVTAPGRGEYWELEYRAPVRPGGAKP